MSAVKPLSGAVHSSMRSGVVLFDLASVVEELVFNSVDAGAKKVSVFVGISNCFVKVVDDGSGITRDGLVLLGERYGELCEEGLLDVRDRSMLVTSKDHQLDDIDSCSGSFGSRGEALASISDIAILEIITKAPGKPNGYRKVLKGSKCLHLGVDDDRKDAGTSVVVRDLFYNQPIRRKSIQSSPKKVLESIKKSVFHVAIIYSEISFQVVDIESDDQLLCTRASTTPLSMLRSFFGNEVVSFLHEMNAREGSLKLMGYLSGPCDSFAIKAFQYVYINSRFVCKSPIHKLVNQLAKEFEYVNAQRSIDGLQKGKRSRSCAGPAYILKLSCPRSLYDLSFEPSKTSVQFKDWVAILAFIEKEIQLFWKVNSSGAMCSQQNFDMLGKDVEFEEEHKSLSGKPEAGELKHSQLSSSLCHLSSGEEGSVELPFYGNRIDIDKMHDNELKIKELHEDIISGSVQDSRDYGTKWRDSCLQKKCGSSEILGQTHVLDIASGFLHLAGDSLVPTSISRNCLENARVLQQVDKKFIPVVAGGTLAVIDQHAADERIRLEELRRKVLSGEAKTISYLESEKELVLPEIGCQLLLNYGEQIKDWGWICNINGQGSRNINLLQRQPTDVTLFAVPCILGVDLNDVDLLEYLQQLADTDGASTMPPAVLHVLNFKACRGAIMFGDTLLLSECSLIVEELKGTSLCFQCAHGRPTTVPLVDLEALHKQVKRLCLPDDCPNDLWHGLRRCEISLERAAKRLDVASR
ncbi:DNA mismatch repair protein MLH3 isoform X2 [Eucalyptus grandis]|uniref:DNA mismatch repair protein MLH3 isoform X2 n=1 Tax=Eucalyptus grandis TaxID=71139 RepID=UPI00192EA5CE|nr:DNA mismatch repair protein MLH3 isoform X2 [Eucalyptus grandis]